MKIPKFWAHSQAPNAIRQPGGKAYWVECWQWSDTSLAEAQQRANDKVRELVLKVQSGATLERYGYGEHPLREEMLQGIQTSTGREVGVVTHNKYGARVLNAASAMFIDVDFDSGQGFGMAQQAARVMTGQAKDILDAYVSPIRDWANRHRDVGLRIYRTAGGLRCLVTNQVFDPTAAESLQILETMGSDPLYVRLCRAQGCFRARLTPKPWRANLALPPAEFPFVNPGLESAYRAWQRQYEQGSAAYGVCWFLQQLGPAEVHPDVAPVLALHDQVTRAGEQRPLA